jgi:hypothetical protein
MEWTVSFPQPCGGGGIMIEEDRVRERDWGGGGGAVNAKLARKCPSNSLVCTASNVPSSNV